MSVSGLPYQTQPLYSNSSQYITSLEARSVIEEVFNDEGIQLSANIPYRKNNTSFVLDGYSQKYNIGYIWMDKFNLEEDAYILWHKKQGKTQKRDYLKGLKFMATSDYANDEVRAQAKQILDISDQGQQEKMYLHFIQKQRLKDIIDADKHPLLTQEATAALDISDEDSTEQQSAFKKVFQIAEIVDFSNDFATSTHLQTASKALLDMQDQQQQQVAFDSLLQRNRDEKMSLNEALTIEKGMLEQQEFIALISQFDERFSYSDKYHTASQKKRKQLDKMKNPAEQLQLAWQISTNKREHLLDNLAKEVHLYIRWAKQQQGL